MEKYVRIWFCLARTQSYIIRNSSQQIVRIEPAKRPARGRADDPCGAVAEDKLFRQCVVVSIVKVPHGSVGSSRAKIQGRQSVDIKMSAIAVASLYNAPLSVELDKRWALACQRSNEPSLVLDVTMKM